MARSLAEVVAIVKPVVEACARRRQTITYSDLSRETNGVRHYRFWHDALCGLSRASLAERGVNLAVLVVGKETGVPGNGFMSCLNDADAAQWRVDPSPVFTRLCEEVFEAYRFADILPEGQSPSIKNQR